ncbi:MAG: response regulator [Candidatus Cyclobacteriaceae bacterium M3_2C_046]
MKQYKVFVIEDNKTEAMVLRLAFSGFKSLDTQYFETGEALINHLPENPDIVLLDLMLPDFHGLELIKKIKENKQDTQIIVVSAQDDIDVVAKAQDEGVFNYIVKSESCLLYIKKVIEDLLIVLNAKKQG